jgi:nucleotide-binding universal stress UspA family protein
MAEGHISSTPATPNGVAAEHAQAGAVRHVRDADERTVIVGLDGREHDADALALARALQAAADGRLLLAHVVPRPPPGRGMTEYAIEARRDGRGLLTRAARGCGPSTQAEMVETWPADVALMQLATDYRASMLVLASSHRGPVGRIVPGSVALRLVARATCPVAVAPVGYAAQKASPIAQLGVAYDATRGSERALEVAADWATRLGVPLRLYHATHPIPTDPGWDEFRAHMQQVAHQIVDSGLDRLPPGAEATTSVLEGNAAAVVAGAARDDGIGLLFVGSRGYGPVREAILGGFVGALLPVAAVPLVIVPTATDG